MLRRDVDLQEKLWSYPDGMAYPGTTATAPAPTGFGAAGGLMRPLPGAKLTDTFGAARSGGRKHEGIDIFAPEGTPIHAVAGLEDHRHEPFGSDLRPADQRGHARLGGGDDGGIVERGSVPRTVLIAAAADLSLIHI